MRRSLKIRSRMIRLDPMCGVAARRRRLVCEAAPRKAASSGWGFHRPDSSTDGGGTRILPESRPASGGLDARLNGSSCTDHLDNSHARSLERGASPVRRRARRGPTRRPSAYSELRRLIARKSIAPRGSRDETRDREPPAPTATQDTGTNTETEPETKAKRSDASACPVESTAMASRSRDAGRT